MKTLMTTDGSEEALAALRTACRLLRKSKNKIEALCVAPEIFLPKGKKEAKKEDEDRIREQYRERITVQQSQYWIRLESFCTKRELMQRCSPRSARQPV